MKISNQTPHSISITLLSTIIEIPKFTNADISVDLLGFNEYTITSIIFTPNGFDKDLN